MKRIIVFLLLAALLLGGCGTRTPEAEAPEAQSVSTAAPDALRDWSEPSAVDDSYSFQHDPTAYYEQTGDDSGLYGLITETCLPEYVDRWVDGGEILWTEFHGLSSGGNQNGAYYGWIAFTGTPKTELGWRTADFNGTECYCRSIFIRELPNGDNTYTIVAAKSWPMEAVLVNDTVAAIGIEDLFSGRMLPTLASAELYVPLLGQSFVMTEETALRSLEKALSKEADTVHITPTGADFGEQETLCPLYLRFADGRRALLFTAGDGADGCTDGFNFGAVFGAESVFERFGVPLDAAGYTHNADGSTTVTNSFGADNSERMMSTARYDAQGRLVYREQVWTWADRDDTDVHTDTVSYREDGKVTSTLGRSNLGQSDEYTTLTTYIYNERGDLTRINVEYDPTDIFGPGYYRELRYDEQNRLVAYVFHYADGREGLPSGNTYFWYTDEGQRCLYIVDADGNLIGGPDGASGDNPLRK